MDPTAIGKAIGGVMEGVGGYFEGRAQGKALEAGARQVFREGGVAAGLELEQTERALARGATLAAASGGGLTGSALTVLDDVARQGVFNARSVLYSAVTAGKQMKYEAKVARRQGEFKLITSLVSLGQSAGGQFAQSRVEARETMRADMRGRAAAHGGSSAGYGRASNDIRGGL